MKKDTVKTTVELPIKLWEAIKIRAVKKQTDLRNIVIKALQAYLSEISNGSK